MPESAESILAQYSAVPVEWKEDESGNIYTGYLELNGQVYGSDQRDALAEALLLAGYSPQIVSDYFIWGIDGRIWVRVKEDGTTPPTTSGDDSYDHAHASSGGFNYRGIYLSDPEHFVYERSHSWCGKRMSVGLIDMNIWEQIYGYALGDDYYSEYQNWSKVEMRFYIQSGYHYSHWWSPGTTINDLKDANYDTYLSGLDYKLFVIPGGDIPTVEFPGTEYGHDIVRLLPDTRYLSVGAILKRAAWLGGNGFSTTGACGQEVSFQAGTPTYTHVAFERAAFQDGLLGLSLVSDLPGILYTPPLHPELSQGLTEQEVIGVDTAARCYAEFRVFYPPRPATPPPPPPVVARSNLKMLLPSGEWQLVGLPERPLNLRMPDGSYRLFDGTGTVPVKMKMRDGSWKEVAWQAGTAPEPPPPPPPPVDPTVDLPPDYLQGRSDVYVDYYGEEGYPDDGYQLRTSLSGTTGAYDYDDPEWAFEGLKNYYLIAVTVSSEEWTREEDGGEGPFWRRGEQYLLSQSRMDAHSTLRIGLADYAEWLDSQGVQPTAVRVRFEVQQGYSDLDDARAGEAAAGDWKLYVHRNDEVPPPGECAPPSVEGLIYTFGRPPEGIPNPQIPETTSSPTRGDNLTYTVNSAELSQDIAFSLYSTWDGAEGATERIPLTRPGIEVPELPIPADGGYQWMAAERLGVKVTVEIDTTSTGLSGESIMTSGVASIPLLGSYEEDDGEIVVESSPPADLFSTAVVTDQFGSSTPLDGGFAVGRVSMGNKGTWVPGSGGDPGSWGGGTGSTTIGWETQCTLTLNRAALLALNPDTTSLTLEISYRVSTHGSHELDGTDLGYDALIAASLSAAITGDISASLIPTAPAATTRYINSIDLDLPASSEEYQFTIACEGAGIPGEPATADNPHRYGRVNWAMDDVWITLVFNE